MPTEIERLYREHRAGLVRLVERELRDRNEAEDVVQTAFLDAQRALERGTIPHNPRAWLAAIALNAARRLRGRRLNAAPLEEYAAQDAPGVSEIRAALTSLPSEQGKAVVYRDVLGFSYGETAEQMGRSVNAVTMLLHRGRRRLRQTLGVTTGGVGLWRWVKRAGMPQVAVAKGTAAVVVAAGLATGGVVAAGRAAREVAPIRTAATAVQVTRAPSLEAGGQIHTVARTRNSARRQLKAAAGSAASPAAASTHGATGDATRAAVRSPTPIPSSTTEGAGRSPSSPKLPVPTVSLPTLPIPTSPVTVAATVTVSTPIAAVTVTTPPGTTATVTTPITTVTVPIP